MIRPGNFISAMYFDEKDNEKFEFAYVVAIREAAHSDDLGEPVFLVVAWLQTIKSTREGVKPWMGKIGLDRSSMILSTEFDVVELDCVADIVVDEEDDTGTVFTCPLSESTQKAGLAIALNRRRWYGRFSGYRSRIHVSQSRPLFELTNLLTQSQTGTVRVETLPKQEATIPSTSPARKRKAKEQSGRTYNLSKEESGFA